MRFDPLAGEQAILQALRQDAAASYGAERAAALDATLAELARALHRAGSQPLELTGPEPDFGA